MPAELKRLHVAVPNYRGLIEAQAHQSMLGLFHYLGSIGQHPLHICPTNTVPATARQMCVDTAINDPTCSHILWIDDDMVFGPEHFAALLKETLDHDLDFCGALAFANSYPTKPCVFGLNPNFAEWGDQPWWHIVTDYPQDQRFEVAATGFGMVITTARLHRTMRGSFTFEPPKGMMCVGNFVFPGIRNEDVSFCFNARKAGFKIWVDSRVKIGHISKDRPVIDEETYRHQGDSLEYSNGVHSCRFKRDSITLEFIGEHPADTAQELVHA